VGAESGDARQQESDMPIYEFKCLQCGEYFEILVMPSEETVEMKCPKCGDDNFEKIMSVSRHAMGGGSGAKTGVTSQTRSCSSGSCTTYEIPGPSR
jgi:putative FmdB family regulatory protein